MHTSGWRSDFWNVDQVSIPTLATPRLSGHRTSLPPLLSSHFSQSQNSFIHTAVVQSLQWPMGSELQTHKALLRRDLPFPPQLLELPQEPEGENGHDQFLEMDAERLRIGSHRPNSIPHYDEESEYRFCW